MVVWRYLFLVLILAGSLSAQTEVSEVADTLQETGDVADTLWAIPCGPMVGTMMSGARVQISDTIAGWAKVTVEAWVPVSVALQYAPVDTIPVRGSTIALPVADEEFHQCEAITLKGTRCSRRAKKGSRYCWQHQSYDTQKR